LKMVPCPASEATHAQAPDGSVWEVFDPMPEFPGLLVANVNGVPITNDTWAILHIVPVKEVPA